MQRGNIEGQISEAVKMHTVGEISTVVSTVTTLKAAPERISFDEINHRATRTNEKEERGGHNLNEPKAGRAEEECQHVPRFAIVAQLRTCLYTSESQGTRVDSSFATKTEFHFSGKHRSRDGPSAPNRD